MGQEVYADRLSELEAQKVAQHEKQRQWKLWSEQQRDTITRDQKVGISLYIRSLEGRTCLQSAINRNTPQQTSVRDTMHCLATSAACAELDRLRNGGLLFVGSC